MNTIKRKWASLRKESTERDSDFDLVIQVIVFGGGLALIIFSWLRQLHDANLLPF